MSANQTRQHSMKKGIGKNKKQAGVAKFEAVSRIYLRG
jgi:hypothetical protein